MNRSTQTYSVSKLTPVQLQQRLIYTQSELAKYKQQLERYQNDYHYSLIDQLHLEKKELEEQVRMQQSKEEELDQLKLEANEQAHEVIELKEKITQMKIAHKEDVDHLKKELDELKKSPPPEQTNPTPHPKELASQEVPPHVPPEKSWFHRSLMNQKSSDE
ncbi:hypothetical protein [Bacillus sp. FJAT-45037]|uniref:hypothetical protein n=1 Tax=Bacillus sp. FJAT-45037 TaxID=2011007 RepID=UPI000C23BD09|nr:hypothetical protein [Bacillus sp. FJAT-45037]